jgi:hypothetical protein
LTSAGNEAWLEYYFQKRGFAIPANVAFGTTLIVKDGQPVNIPVDYEDLYEYKKILLWYCYFPIPEDFRKTVLDERVGVVLYER